MSLRMRIKVQCFCDKCEGNKLVDPRTKIKHEEFMSRKIKYQKARLFVLPDDDEMYDNGQETGPSDEMSNIEIYDNGQEAGPFGLLGLPDEIMREEMDDEQEAGPSELLGLPDEIMREEMDDDGMEFPKRNYNFLTKKLPMQSVKKGKISNRIFENLLLDDNDQNRHSKDPEDNDQNIDSENKVDSENDEYEEINFASPNFDDKPKRPNTVNNHHMHYCWIILCLLLSTIDKNKFLSFPSSLYIAKKELGIPTDIIQYAACNKCHKLYDINELLGKTEVQTCSFINFPNHTIQRFRQPCNNPLTKEINNNNQQIYRPIMTYPIGNIRQQLTLFFGRKDFETSCREWANRKNDTEALFNIYDVHLWNGYNIITHESNNDRFIRGAIIGYSSDVPATRKLCGFISSRIVCYRCHKFANFVGNQPNFGGFSDFEDWFVDQDIKIIREKASEWKQCQTEESQKAHVSQHYVCWFEIYNLHYFNPVRHCVVDPMHCLFLRVAK
ncbi:hypothetical protein RhiirA5_405934 [Rhizophagus irregularis]|uniref:Uncharacterized protein n=1 Tax=Rhizophagus irregularis TaxID=588596 RepID=A0A2I1FBU8_9GLOM|nr:hypothetical protein RhiirA5_405934 [Rhizophagus irregularis]PKY31861.1 hypothetical protein RhiirB3_449679 [Rhizophagus irregularis]